MNNYRNINLNRLAFVFLLLLHLANTRCVMYQEFEDKKPTEAKTEEQKTPKIYDEYMDVCPEYLKKPVCCSPAARKIMSNTFGALDLVMPCQTCANNMRRFL